MAQWVVFLLYRHKDLSLDSRTPCKTPGVVMPAGSLLYGSETERLLGLAGHQSSSRLSDGQCQRVMEDTYAHTHTLW